MAKNKVILSGVLVLLVLVIVVGIGLFTSFGIDRQSFIPDTCNLLDSGSGSGSFSCPSDASLCNVDVTLECDVPSNVQKVEFRFSDNGEMPEQVAYDLFNSGSLLAFSLRSDTTIASSSRTFLFNMPSPSQSRIYRINDRLAVCHPREGTSGDLCRPYDIGGSIPTSLEPTEPYASTGREFYDGNVDAFVCEQDVTGDVTKTVFYSSNIAGSVKSNVVLNGGQTIGWSGLIEYDINRVEVSECTGDVADPSNPSQFFECTLDSSGCGVLSDDASFCDGDLVYNAEAGSCTVPYTFVLSTSKDVYAVGETISGSFEIRDTSDREFVDVRVEAVDNLGVPRAITLSGTNSRGQGSWVLNGLSSIGEYTIIATPDHPLGSFPFEKKITVSQPIFVRLSPFPDRIQFNSDNIQAKAFVTDSSGNPKDARNWDLSGTRCGSTDVSGSVQIQRLKTGEYLLSTPVRNTCTFIYKVSAIDDAGFRSEPDSIDIEVRAAEVEIQPDFSTVQDKDEGRYSISFRTLDSNLQPVDTSNQVVVTDSNGCTSGLFCTSTNEFIPSVVVTGDDGLYSFSHNYKAGLNIIMITSNAQGIESSTQEFIVNLFPSGSTNPTTPNTGGSNTGLIVTALLVVIGIGGFIYLVFRKKK